MDLDAAKRAETKAAVQDVIARRWSPRSFSSRPVDAGDLLACLEAARWAPSCFNEQPWRYIVTIAGESAYDKLFDSLGDWNQQWVRGVPVLMLSMAVMTFSKNGMPNRHAYHDTGMATMSLVLEAQSRGIFAHQMGGYSDEKARSAFSIPDDVETVDVIAMGYRDAPERLPTDEFREIEVEPRTRRALGDVFFGAMWGESSEIVT